MSNNAHSVTAASLGKSEESVRDPARFVRGWMTARPYTCPIETTLADANDILDEHGFRRLPVVDEEGNLAGIISRSDLRSASPSSITSLSLFEVNYMWAKLTVSDVMATDPITISPDDTMKRAAELMLANKVSALPVIESAVESHKLIGILTETDMLRYLVTL